MIKTAKSLVLDYIKEHIDTADPALFVVWEAHVLQNFKCLIATPLNGMYFELTYDGDNQCWYLDAYRKVDNREIDNDAVHEQPN